jgi:propanol-preferring alcohol dehydrogenase
LCDAQKNTGYSVNGGFAEYVLADPNYVGHLPNTLDWETAAPILCAGVTVYKGLKETDTKPGDTVVISGIGGLGHIAVQYAKAMGLEVIAVDVSNEKLALAREMGASAVVNASTTDPIAEVQALCGGAQGVLVTAVSPKAFSQALGMLAKRGTMSLVGLPPGSFELDIFNTVLMRKTIRGSIVGTRLDLAECLRFAGDGKVRVHYSVEPLNAINSIFDRMRNNKIDGRVVMKI